MLFEEVTSLINDYEMNQEAARSALANEARTTVLHFAREGSRKSTMQLQPGWAEQVSWLRKEWRGQGVHISVSGGFLHFNAVGPRGPGRRRSVQREDWER